MSFFVSVTFRSMEFKNEELVEREREIAGYLLQHFSFKHISDKTGLSRKLLAAHINNMMKKLHAEDVADLIRLLRLVKL